MKIRQTIAVAAAVAMMMGFAAASWADTAAVKLFKVISPKDEVEIGLTDDELKGPGKSDVENLAKKLVDAGQITVWQYAVHKNANGDLEHAPLKKIAILKQDTFRIEPFDPKPLKVIPPAN